ncbi:MAG TPA: NrfD/PsrC family molybdoenzyme membrane anchor subunit [Chloroflexota bacterium]|nr:NrfD/PsrC family molybdoenzyme membrane anchor subunit [Chloroflexota bacterium]
MAEHAPEYARRWEARGRGRSVADEARTSYYGLPVLHKPHWNWLIIVYFFVGGLAGASYALASLAQLVGGAEGGRIARVGRYLALAGTLLSPLLLILDLGRPERFHHMLRVVKLRSPMSIGTWSLVVFGGFSTLSALGQAAQDGLLGRRGRLARLLRALPARLIGLLGLGPALLVGGYTGVLLAATAVPLWTKNYLLMGPLFLTSALSNATAAITLVLALARGTPRRTLARLERLEVLTLLVELALLVAARLNLGRVIARPLTVGRLGRLYRWGVLGAGLAAPLALQAPGVLAGRPPGRGTAVLAAALTLVGGFLFRYVMVVGGRQSADDPAATFALTRGRDQPRP